MPALTENLLLQVASVIRDEVTTTDELIPSGETASYRSNPYKISEFTLIRKDPQYVGRAKAAQEFEKARVAGDKEKAGTFYQVLKAVGVDTPVEELMKTTGIGSVLYAKRPGDGSAREYAASCQKVLGGTSASSMRQRDTAATASTGEFCRSHVWKKRSFLSRVSTCIFRESAKQWKTVRQDLRQK